MTGNDNNPIRLHGLRQDIFVLEQLCKGRPTNEVVEELDGDEQLVDLWTNFLVHNHWAAFDIHSKSWVLTEKGEQWIYRIENIMRK